VADATRTLDFLQAADVHLNLAAKVTLNTPFLLNHLAELGNIRLRYLCNFSTRVDTDLLQNFSCAGKAYTKNIRKCVLDALIAWEIHASNTGHYNFS
jgi:hypothetical protein